MRFRNVPTPAARRGFTLIELLVVISIIAVLMGLLMSGVMAVLQAKDRTGNQFDVGKLDQSMNVALQKYGQGKTLPGYLVLYNNTEFYRDPSKLPPAEVKDAERSKAALQRMFGSRFITSGGPVNWDGTGGTGVANKVTLEGQQCLVFYLGGVADTSAGAPRMTGFSENPLNPLDTAAKGRIGPFYEFEANRLTNARYPSYLDRYGTPIAYFGGTGGANSYVGGCPSLPGLGASAGFPDGAGRFMKPSGFQIVSAGRNKAFGSPAAWNPLTGSTDGNARDDVSNFSGVPLNNPQK